MYVYPLIIFLFRISHIAQKYPNDDDPHHTSWFNNASSFGPPRSRQIWLKPVWLVGCERECSAPERSMAER